MVTPQGPFPGGDPRRFTPGPGATADQRRDHRVACQAWDDADARGSPLLPEDARPGLVLGEDGVLIRYPFTPDYSPGIYDREPGD